MNAKTLLAGLALLAPVVAAATPNATVEQATVLWWEARCNFFVVQTPSGFTLFEWLSGPKPALGQVMEGPMEGFGPRNLINKSADDQVTLAYTEVHSTSKKWVADKIPGFCKRKKDFVAQVERERAGGQPGADAPPAAPSAPAAAQ
jgi:hypothetical protein